MSAGSDYICPHYVNPEDPSDGMRGTAVTIRFEEASDHIQKLLEYVKTLESIASMVKQLMPYINGGIEDTLRDCVGGCTIDKLRDVLSILEKQTCQK